MLKNHQPHESCNRPMQAESSATSAVAAGKLAIIAAALLVTLPACSAEACNIPVFRYALERWQSDPYEVIVFYDQQLTIEQSQFLKQWTAAGGDEGHANIQVVLSNIREQPSPAHAALWQNIRESTTATLPYLVIQTKFRNRVVNSWHGSLNEAAKANLLTSPVRTELANRLLGGDSVIWLMLKSRDSARNLAAQQLLQSATKTLTSRIELPEGVGLPGSELYSEIPLLLQFSILEIDPDDKREQFLVQLFTSFQSDAYTAGDPLVVPIFGRGRALEVIPASTLNEKLIEELTVFLSGPCSCQVKNQNPGFDLLLSADWESELFGAEGLRPPTVSATAPVEPKLLTIPPGRKR